MTAEPAFLTKDNKSSNDRTRDSKKKLVMTKHQPQQEKKWKIEDESL